MADQNSNTTGWKNAVIFKYLPLQSLIGIIAGAIGGYVYYTQVVCVTGGCPLTSNPFITVLWGALMGYLLADMFTKKKPVKSE
jgi:hypothetical protein